ncbi:MULTISPECIES: GGDEF domain-containing protein [unclassified Novosphingobium]|uniref:GGDEF domain-containing protein n=1 Tax=unclassified Novosphingobium TaxID=2644732 RepID=UPI00135A880E|nr:MULTISPECIES: GGDEF domain-containing protein [unclassified Novosphingobium]
MEHLFASPSMTLCVLDRSHRVTMASPSMSSIFMLDTIAGSLAGDLVPGAGPVVQGCFDLAALGHALPDRYFTAGGRHYQVTFHATADRNGGIFELLLIVLDVTRRVQVEHLLRESRRRLIATARRDHLTGLLNRRGLESVLHRELRRSRRAGKSLSLIAIDIDWFKDYNDSLGHPQGDACLYAVARALIGCLRRAGDAACRYGGEEFLLVLPDTDIGGAATVAANCQRAIDDLNIPHPGSPFGRVTVSFGIAEAAAGADGASVALDAISLLSHADSALYRAKRDGRNRIEFALGA